MSWKRTYSISLLTVLAAMVPFCAIATPTTQNETPSVSLHGLESIGIDTWTQLLQKGRETGLSVSDLRPLLHETAITAKNEQQTFKKIRETLKTARLHSADDYRDLGLMLLELRQEMRQRSDLPLKSLQDSLYLLQLMAEESLYIGSKKFTNFPAEISFSDKVSTFTKTGSLRQFSVQTGDVVLSKSTGFGSSSFIALTMDHPHIYSHSTPVYIDAKGEVLSPEAEIEDGVKLRNMRKDYVEGSKTRMYIYRFQGTEPGVPEKVVAGMENLVAEMFQRTGGDPYNKAAFLYDFSMTPGEASTRGLFCSSVAYEAYTRAGLNNSANPYEKSLWSPINKGREVLLRSLNMNTYRVPAPGDMELNKNFRLVGARVDVTKLHQDRIEMAIIDTFLTELDANKEAMARLSAVLEGVASKSVDKEGLLKMAHSGLLPKELADKAALIQKIPDSINLKQMAFFALLNEVMTPKLRGILLNEVSALEKQGRLVGPMELRQMVRAQRQTIETELAAFEQKLTAITGVGLCGKILL